MSPFSISVAIGDERVALADAAQVARKVELKYLL